MGVRLAGAVAGVAISLAGFSIAGVLHEQNAPPSALAASSCIPIGYQNGISAARARMTRIDPGGFNAAATGAWDKFFRSVSILVNDHDAGCVQAPPPTTTTSPPTTTAPPALVAPLTYNRSARGDARFCVDALPRNAAGRHYDAYATYDDGGLQLGGRSESIVPGLRFSDNMNGLGPCDSYSEGGRTFPPWPEASYSR